MKEMLSRAFNKKQSTQNFSSKQEKKNILKKINNLTAFEPKHVFRCFYGTD